jgi:hypothetical protein
MKIHLVGAELVHVDGRTDRQTDTGRQTDARNIANGYFSQLCESVENLQKYNSTHCFIRV